MSVNTASDSLLPEEVISVLKARAQGFFAHELSPLINSLIDKLVLRQREGVPIRLRQMEIEENATYYAGAVRRAAQRYCEDLAQAVGARRGIAKEDEDRIRVQVEQFIIERISLPAIQALFNHTGFADFSIENRSGAEQVFFKTLTHLAENTTFLILHADRVLKEAAALYPPKVSSAEGSEKQVEAMPPFNHSPDYRTILLNGSSYTLTSRQAQIVQLLHEALENRTPELSQAYILERLGTPNSRLSDTFRGTEMWGLIIKSGKRRGLIRLALPDSLPAD